MTVEEKGLSWIGGINRKWNNLTAKKTPVPKELSSTDDPDDAALGDTATAGFGELAADKPKEATNLRKRGRNLLKMAAKPVDDIEDKETPEQLTERKLVDALKGFAGYAVFLAIFCVVAFSTRSPDDYWANLAMQRLMVTSPFHLDGITHEKTLTDIHFFGQFFSWLRGPFIETIYTPDWGSEPLFLHGYNRIIGPVRLRQLRVQPDSCNVPDVFSDLIDGCWGPCAIAPNRAPPCRSSGRASLVAPARAAPPAGTRSTRTTWSPSARHLTRTSHPPHCCCCSSS
jgi:hypothetical protein